MAAARKRLVARGKKGRFKKRDWSKTIKVGGKKLDYMILEAAKTAVAGKGDGRISRTDSRLICKAARPSGDGRSTYDKVEKDTMAYIRKKFKFTKAGDAAVRQFIRGQAAKEAARTRKAKKAMKA
mmetsp:Transcript_5286/g.12737  ORF Transcript_5286/g.12737 Transcript_5286/m.12737 type:complete len:125 (+) Transcript_5286:78-452(+)